MSYLDEILIEVRSGRYEVIERTPLIETISYYRMIELYKHKIIVKDYPLSKHDFQEYKTRRENDRR